MKARTLLLLFPVALGWATAAEPKARPRLAPLVVSEVKRDAAPPTPGVGSEPGFRSFDDFLQTQARRPPGLEAIREASAPRSEADGAGKTGQATKDSPPASVGTDSGGKDILILPNLEVTAERLTKLEKQLAALEANQSWEEKSAEAWDRRTVVDAILNPPFLKLGNYSGAGRAFVARQRVELLRWVRILRISLKEAKTPPDKARIEADIEGIVGIMRMWE